MGANLLQIKHKTQDDHVRICVSELEGIGDASALKTYYHKKCLQNAQRTIIPTGRSTAQLIRSLWDEQICAKYSD